MPVRLPLRVLAGTALYALILLLAAALPPAAGLMLTFPTLNGLAFAFALRDRIPGMTASMLWMPVLNGALCAGYMLAFLALAPRLPPDLLAILLLLVIVGLWAAFAVAGPVRTGVPARRQLAFVLAVTLGGVLLAAAAVALVGPASPTANTAPAPLAQTLADNGLRITLFAASLLVFLIATEAWPLPDAGRGILAGLPIVPFAGLFSVAGDGRLAPAARLEIFAGMAAGLALGPAIAAWFIYGFSRYLHRRPTRASAQIDQIARYAALLTAWALCGAAIVGVVRLLLAARAWRGG
jgi:hypothetical protein